MIAIVDFGSQYGQLIARRVREHNVYSIIVQPSVKAAELASTGRQPASFFPAGRRASMPKMRRAATRRFLSWACRSWASATECRSARKILGANVAPAQSREYGRTNLNIIENKGLVRPYSEHTTVWMSHGDQVNQLNNDFIALATTPTCPFAAVRHKSKPFYGVQFHPEVTHTPRGSDMLKNFLYDICKCTGNWQMRDFAEQAIEAVREKVGDATVICGLSGGVDSAVTAALIHKAIGDQLVCIFVDNGLLRKNERENVESTFRDHFHIDLHVVDWSKQFLSKLAGVTDPQQKRKIIGAEFIEAFKSEANKIPNAKFLAQGTLYPDVIESGKQGRQSCRQYQTASQCRRPAGAAWL